MIRRSLARLCALVGVASVGIAEAAPRGDDSFALPRAVEETLDNGLKVLVVPRPGVGLVDVRIVVKVGAWLEGEHEGSGLSHYAEHLVAGGTTETTSEEESAERLRRIGGLKNARTEADRTWVYVTTTPDGLEDAVALLSDWVRRPEFPADEFERERNVIRQEIDQADDQDARQAWDLLHAVAFTRHPARFPLLGERARFEALTREDVVAFHARHWVPGNAIVSVVGDVQPSEGFHVVRRAFEGWERARVPKPRLAVEPPPSGRREGRRAGVSPRSSVALGWRAVPFAHEDAIPLQVAKAIVADGADARLVDAVVDSGLAGGLLVRARTPALGGGLFVVLAHVEPSDVKTFEERVAAALARLGAEGPTDEELRRAKRRMRAELVLGTRSVEDLAHAMTRDWVAFEDARFAETYVERLAEVTGDDVRRAAARTFVPERLSVAVVGAAERSVAESDGGRSAASAVTKLSVETVAGGMNVVLEPVEGAPEASLCVVLAAGSLREREDEAGASAVLAELLLRTDAAASARARLEEAGGSVSVTADRFAVELSASALADDVPALLDLLEAVVTAPPAAPEAVAAVVGRARAELASHRRSPRLDVEDRLLARAFGEALSSPEPEDLDRLDPTAALRYAEEAVSAPNVTVALVGGFDAARARERVASFAGRVRGGTAWAPRVEAPSFAGFAAEASEDGAGRSVFEPTPRKQVSAAWAFEGAGVDASEERVALDLLDAWWSGRRIPSGPLVEALRGARDLAYHVEAVHQPLPGGGLFWVLVQCAPERFAEVSAAVEGALADLAAARFDEDELRSGRNVLLASRQSVVQTSGARARLHALAPLYGLTPDGGDAYRTLVEAATLDAVRDAARRRFSVPARRLVLWPEEVPRP